MEQERMTALLIIAFIAFVCILIFSYWPVNYYKKRPVKFKTFGCGYDYETALASGIKPNDNGHWPSIEPNTGMLLKGYTHPTIHLTVQAEHQLGRNLVLRRGRFYSINVQQKKNKRIPK